MRSHDHLWAMWYSSESIYEYLAMNMYYNANTHGYLFYVKYTYMSVLSVKAKWLLSKDRNLEYPFFVLKN